MVSQRTPAPAQHGSYILYSSKQALDRIKYSPPHLLTVAHQGLLNHIAQRPQSHRPRFRLLGRDDRPDDDDDDDDDEALDPFPDDDADELDDELADDPPEADPYADDDAPPRPEPDFGGSADPLPDPPLPP